VEGYRKGIQSFYFIVASIYLFIYVPLKALVVIAQSYQNTRNFIYLRMHSIGNALPPGEQEKMENIFESFRKFTRVFFIEAFYQQL